MTSNIVFNILLTLHIVGGSIALLAGYGALVVKRGGPRHRLLGKIYVGGMVTVVLTGFPMSILHPNPFLFGIVLFSGYFVFSGWTAAAYRKGETLLLERAAAVGLTLLSLSVIIYLVLAQGDSSPFLTTGRTTGLVFALIGVVVAGRDSLVLRSGPLLGKDRIIKHLISMCAALISTTTAVAVTVLGAFPQIPELVLWIGPTLVLSPVISYWARQVKVGSFKY